MKRLFIVGILASGIALSGCIGNPLQVNNAAQKASGFEWGTALPWVIVVVLVIFIIILLKSRKGGGT